VAESPGRSPTASAHALAWIPRAVFVLALLYLFLVGVSSLEAGIKALGADFQVGLLERVDHPLAGLFAGILATVLVQSSSVSTATIVGLVGAGTLTIDAAVPMIMGANIGTTVTSTIASLGHVRRGEEFKRAFSAATVHDIFNVMAVIVFLPIQLWTKFLSATAEDIAELLGGSGVRGGKPNSPFKQAVKEPVSWAKQAFEAITDSDQLLGFLLIAFGLLLIFGALAFITKSMRLLIAERIELAMNKLISRGGGLPGMVAGLLMTVAVQSSSITTSILVPMVGAGVLTLRNAFPVTLGANLGTTVTALLASLAVDLRAGLVVALTHTLFNLFGILAIYPIPAVRLIPVRLAERLANRAAENYLLVGVYVVGLFLVVPMIGIVVFG
jgi:solute carrier family 34 (sodium-dependent phosphate cotransporter)